MLEPLNSCLRLCSIPTDLTGITWNGNWLSVTLCQKSEYLTKEACLSLLGVVFCCLRLYPVGTTVQRYPIKDIILQNYHIPAGVSLYSGMHSYFNALTDFDTFSLRRWFRCVFTLLGGVQTCLRTHSALTPAGGAAARSKAKEAREQGSDLWPLGSGRGSASGGGSLRTRCNFCSCMWVTADKRRMLVRQDVMQLK